MGVDLRDTMGGEKMLGRLNRNAWGRQQGFTLVELLAVMAILAILAAFTVPKFTGVLASSKEKACMANAKLIQDAANLYAANEPNPIELTAENIMATLKGAGYLREGSFTCPVSNDKYQLSGDATAGYAVTCPNGCDGKL